MSKRSSSESINRSTIVPSHSHRSPVTFQSMRGGVLHSLQAWLRRPTWSNDTLENTLTPFSAAHAINGQIRSGDAQINHAHS